MWGCGARRGAGCCRTHDRVASYTRVGRRGVRHGLNATGKHTSTVHTPRADSGSPRGQRGVEDRPLCARMQHPRVSRVGTHDPGVCGRPGQPQQLRGSARGGVHVARCRGTPHHSLILCIRRRHDQARSRRAIGRACRADVAMRTPLVTVLRICKRSGATGGEARGIAYTTLSHGQTRDAIMTQRERIWACEACGRYDRHGAPHWLYPRWTIWE